ncbi:sugar ABC transporter [Skermanella stibiiresistens SB22]|uniref:Sugar ABC transporter n=1 Tax=Skermanella stibiiresistens SB22 TaxID=1385369 RepID=W9H8M4_9PROT|nr:ATP-binding cassette domain-containing protein [Skermanella stibiiresistens]EWY41037.1 sugar ABC transporter [Skermanella stibiiresistens SB22]
MAYPALSEKPDTVPASATTPPVVALDHITRTFGPTTANDDVSLAVPPGAVIGLIGANGAGKSTLMRVLCGVTEPDSGTLTLGGTPVAFPDWSPTEARRRGIRIVFQELSLCVNLTVAENFYLEDPSAAAGTPWGSPLWRGRYRKLARAGIDAVFPDSGIDVDARLSDLALGQRQMVEIARAARDPNLRLLILDEPTSSLDAGRAAQLQDFVRRSTAKGIAFIFISHKLREVLEIASRVVVMRNGRVTREGGADAFTVHALVELMGGEAGRTAATSSQTEAGREILRITGPVTAPLGHDITLHAGDIVGFAGLEGSGQRTQLHRIRLDNPDAGFVSGDRQREGVFPQWTVLSNISIGALSRRPLASIVSTEAETETGRHWAERLRLDPGRLSSNVLHLSGGNQQKALVARALARQSDILLLDDPTRGVDVASKHDFYRVVRQTAEAGAVVVWYSTEDIELLECTRVLVFHKGAIVRELVGAEISEESIVDTAFLHEKTGHEKTSATPTPAAPAAPPRSPHRAADRLTSVIPLISLAAVCAALATLNPASASLFGIDLLLSSAVPLVLIALAQMFVVGGSQIDLGIGAFAGLVNVVGATVLTDQPALGVVLLAAGIGGYAIIGALIERRRIPAIVVTLGASFIWLGCGYTLQSAPGGMAPDWLMAAVAWQIPGLPTSLLLILAAGVCGLLVDRSRLGVVLRGFGNNAAALSQGGWSALRHTMLRYVIAGVFAMMAGLALTAITTASDINAGSGFTLLSIAAVVIGGCHLLGGTISAPGVVAGAVTLSLIGSLLSFLGVSTDYNAAVQGLLLVAILGLRTLLERRESAE